MADEKTVVDILAEDKVQRQQEATFLEAEKVRLSSDKTKYADEELARIDKLLGDKSLGKDIRAELTEKKATILKSKSAYVDKEIALIEGSRLKTVAEITKIDAQVVAEVARG